MATMKQNRRRKRTIAVPLVGAVGASMAVAGGAYATGVVGSPSGPSLKNDVPGPQINLSEEEISDVNLGTFFVFDRENLQEYGEQYAQRGCRGGGGAARCGGGGRCAVARCGGGAGRCAVAPRRGCAGCRGCSVGGCRSCVACAGCSGCSCGCCLSWGACRFIC
jgi:hypothetical protein